MFENYVVAKKTRQISPTLLGLASMVMASALFGMVIYSWLKIEKLETPSTGIQIGLDLPPPPPPPKGGGKKKLEAKKKQEPKKVKPVDTVQPVKVEQKQDEPVEDTSDDSAEGEGDPNGVEGGVEGGVVGGQLGGVVGGVQGAPPPPPPPPPPPAPPQNIAPTALEAQRIAGEKNIVPDDVTKTEIQRSGKTQLMVPVKVCIDRAGAISSVKVLKSSGFPAYDAKLTREINKWRYRPFSVNGTPTPVCSAIQFIYRQK